MSLVLVFLLGIANFTAHAAVLASGHLLLGRMPWFFHLLGGRISLVVEFLMLLASLLTVAQGASGWAWGYACYTAANAFSAWLVVDRRV